MGPAADAGEQVDLGEAGKVATPQRADVPLVNDAVGNVSGRNKIPEPGRRVGVIFIGNYIDDSL